MMIVNDDSRVANKLEASLTDDDRVIIHDRHMFIVQATEVFVSDKHFQPSLIFDSNADAYVDEGPML